MEDRSTRMKPEDVLKPERLDWYTQEMRYFHGKLTVLHQNDYFIRRIIEFPLDLFVNQGDDFFLEFVLANFSQMAILQITRLVSDSGGDVKTLRKFKNSMSSAVREELLLDYKQRLKQAKFDSRVEELLGKAKGLRDKQIAHSIPGDPSSLTFDELSELKVEVTKLFDVASFNIDYHFLFIAYNPMVLHPRGVDSRPDIERILDSIAQDSVLLHLPERRPEEWEHERETWPVERLERFNRYRRKLGLPEA